MLVSFKGIVYGSISWNWKRQKDESLYGSRAYETDNDFSSEKNAKNTVNAYFSAQECGKCGSKDLNGDNIMVELTEVKLYREVKKNGFFGGEKMVEEYWKTVYRVGSILFPQAHLFSSGGHFKCRKCGHRMGACGFFGQWAANIARGSR